MANNLEVRKQLHLAGFRNHYWGWSAIRQLPMILERDEEIERVATGMYSDGHAVVLATNKRIIILDKKVMSFRAEDIHYEMVSEVEHYLGPFAAKLRIHSLSKSFEFTSLRAGVIQNFAIHVDQKVNDIRLSMKNVTSWSEQLDMTGGTNIGSLREQQNVPTLRLRKPNAQSTANVGNFVQKR